MIANETNTSNFVWIPDKIHCWYPAIIIEHDKIRDEYTVETLLDQNYYHNINKYTMSVSKTHPIDPSHQLDLDNMCLMNNMHEAPLLDLLRRRFYQSKIYTFSGNVLISLNPYRVIKGLYENPEVYLNLNLNSYSVSNNDNEILHSVMKDQNNESPHVYSIANSALSELISTTMKIEIDKLINKPINANINTLVDTTTTTTTTTTNDSKNPMNIQYHNHSIIISGESGAGKTENSKHVINFLILANNEMKLYDQNQYNKIDRKSDSWNSTMIHNIDNNRIMIIEDNIYDATQNLKFILLHSSIVLESFGNSKTVRNDNSSRFGKYIKLVYHSKNITTTTTSSMNINNTSILSFPLLVSSITETFLLEKSRLVMIGYNERNYHIFYQLIRGLSLANNELCMKLKLNVSVDAFHILTQGNCTVVHSIQNDVDDFLKISQALQSLHCNTNEIEQIYILLACILHLGNITCHDDDDKSNSIELVCDSIELNYLAELLGVHVELFIQALTTQRVVIAKRTSIKLKYLSVLEIKNNLSALMKWIYNRLFSWLVRKINHAHNNDLASYDNNSFIGILDIFGFEILNTNSFEQLCINFTNEKLQQQFNEYVFTNEQEMYKLEGLQWSNISYRDNQHVIDLISSIKAPKQGLLLLLEEQGMLNRAPDDIALVKTFNTIHEPIGATARLASAYQKSKFGNNGFVIKHFAGDVNYTIDGFLIKNNDALQEDLLNLLKTSTNVFLCNALDIGESVPDGPGFILDIKTKEQSTNIINPETIKKTTMSGKKMASSSSVSQQFRVQLDTLLNTLRQTKPHYIKCIKSNTSKQEHNFEANLVMDQLRYSGVLEVVRIRREGFPIRMKFIDFYRNYEIFAVGKSTDIFPGSKNCHNESQALQCCSIIASIALLPDQYQIGHTLIFLRNDGLQALDLSIKKFYSSKVTKIQSAYKTLFMKRKYKKICLNVILCQSIIRRYIKRNYYKRIRASIIKIQELYLSRILRDRFLFYYSEILKNRKLLKVIKIQKNYRGYKVRCKYRKLLLEKIREKKCIIIQKYYRRYQAIKLYKHLCYKYFQLKYKSTVKIQSIFRCFQMKKKFIHYKTKAIFIQLSLSSRFHSKVQVYKYKKIKMAIVLIQNYWKLFKDKTNILYNVIKIQSFIRCYNVRKLYKIKLKSIILIQTRIRCFLIMNQFIKILLSIIIIQTNIRGYLARKYTIEKLCSILLIQATIRGKIVRNYIKQIKLKRIIAAKTIQAFYRKVQNNQNYYIQIGAAIKIQSIIRGKVCRNYVKQIELKRIIAAKTIQAFYRKVQNNQNYYIQIGAAIKIQSIIRLYLVQKQITCKFYAILLLQSYCRMWIINRKYLIKKFYITKIQSIIRMIQTRIKYIIGLGSILYLQCWLKKIIQYNKYKKIKSNIRFIICYIKYWIFRRNKYAKDIMNRNILKYIRKRKLYHQLNNLHKLLMGFQKLDTKFTNVSNIKLNDSKKRRESICMKYHITIKNERNRWFEFCTIYHSAIIGGDVNLFRQLNPDVKDMFITSSKGRNAIHFFSLNPNKNILKLIKLVFATFKYNRKNVINRILEEDDVDQDSIQNKEQVNELKKALSTSVGSDTLMKGWLKKKRDSYLFQKRYVVLTEDYLIYYQSDTTLNNPKFAIPLCSVSLRRVTNNKEPIFEISSPFMIDKKNIFGNTNHSKKSILFLTDSEKSLQDWLKPLKVITGMAEGLRSPTCINTPPVYINLSVINLWASSIDLYGNTSLHILVFHQLHDDIYSPMYNNKNILLDTKSQVIDLKQTDSIIKYTCWLIENGCPINYQNNNGHTALHLLLLQSNQEDKINKKLIYCLIYKGADIFILKDNNNLTVMDIINASEKISKNLKIYLKKIITLKNQIFLKHQDMNCNINTITNINRINNKLKGYSYLSFYVTDCIILNVQNIKNIHDFQPCITFSVYNNKNKLLEQEYMIYNPILSSINIHSTTSKIHHCRLNSHRWDLFWGSIWHMQTPLENLESNSYILIKLYLKHDNLMDYSLVYWTRYLINTDIIDTTYDEVLPLQLPASMVTSGAMLSNSSYNFNNMKYMYTNPVQSSFPIEFLHDNDYKDLSDENIRIDTSSTNEVNYILVDCILHQRDRTINVKDIID